jgi:hypothetical protein
VAELEDVKAKLLSAIDQKLHERPGASKTIMELARAYESLARASEVTARPG